MKHLSLNRFVCLCAALAVATFVNTANAQEEYRAPKSSDGQLKWKFSEGMALKQVMDQKVTMNMDMGFQKMEMQNNGITEMTMVVKSVDENGVALTENTIDRMMVETKAPGADIKFDTASTEEGSDQAAALSGVLTPMIGKAISQKMAPNGKISDVEVPEGMLSGVKTNPMMAQMFNENTMKEMTSKASVAFPNEQMKIGDEWTQSMELMMGPANVVSDNSYTYLGVTELNGTPVHVISGKVEMAFPDGIQGMDVDIPEQDSTIKFYFDGNKGRMVKTTLDQNVSMEISGGGQNLSQILKQKMTLDISDK
ncbi:MAG: DUF6263 family protein [Planctomycetota bacterium]